MRILWLSNGQNVNSSYGTQTRLILPILQALGHEVACLAWPGISGGPANLGGVHTFPGSSDQYSQNTVGIRANQWGADVVISFMDAFVLQPEKYPQARHIPYYPVDTNMVRYRDQQVLKGAWDSVSFSGYGQEKAKECGINSHFIPLMVNTAIFRPLDKIKCREQFGLPIDKLIFGVVSANNEEWPTRKGWYELLQGFALFLPSCPSALLYCHTSAYTGVNLPALAESLGITANLVFTQQEALLDGLTDAGMAVLYNCLDCLVVPSKGEGFCLPLIEAQACGVIPLTGTHTALGENAGAGFRIAEADCVLEPATNAAHEGTYRYYVNPGAIRDGMLAMAELAYLHPEDCLKRRQECLDFAQAFSPQNVAPLWHQLLSLWEQRIKDETNGQQTIPLRPRPDLTSDFAESVHKASVNVAQVVIVCPSYGERCGIAEYTGYQVWELFKAGIRAHICTTVAEACMVANLVPSVTSVIVHHEYSLYDNGNERLCMGEHTPNILRQLDFLYRTTFTGGRQISIGIVQHTVSTHPLHDAQNKLLASSGVPLFATSFAGVRYMAEHYGAKINHVALGTWSIPMFQESYKKAMYAFDTDKALTLAREHPEVLRGLTEEEWVKALFQDGIKAAEEGIDSAFMYPVESPRLTIGNFGMLGPQRDIAAMIELCKRTDSQLYGSFATNDRVYCDAVVKAVVDAGVPAKLQHDWPDDLEIMSRLSKCDILYMPRQTQGWFYSSASVLSALNVRRPIIANADPGYADLHDVLCIAETVEQAVAHVERLRDPNEYVKQVAKQEEYIRSRNVASVYQKAGLLNGLTLREVSNA